MVIALYWHRQYIWKKNAQSNSPHRCYRMPGNAGIDMSDILGDNDLILAN